MARGTFFRTFLCFVLMSYGVSQTTTVPPTTGVSASTSQETTLAKSEAPNTETSTGVSSGSRTTSSRGASTSTDGSTGTSTASTSTNAATLTSSLTNARTMSPFERTTHSLSTSPVTDGSSSSPNSTLDGSMTASTASVQPMIVDLTTSAQPTTNYSVASTTETSSPSTSTSATSPAFGPTPPDPDTTPFVPVTIFPTDPAANLCSCDLAIDACDVDCCCDPACPPGVKDNAFVTCRDVVAASATSPLALPFCLAQDVVYRTNGLPFRTNVTSDGLFCIDTVNYEEQQFYPQLDPLASSKDIELEITSRSNEQQNFDASSDVKLTLIDQEILNDLTLEAARNASVYKSGSPVVVLKSSDTCDTFNLPRSTLTAQCSDSTPTLFLRDADHVCRRKTTDLKTECGRSGSVFDPGFYLGHRLLPGRIIIQAENSFSVKACGEPNPAFQQLIIPSSSGVVCKPSFDNSNSACLNAVKSVTYRIIVSTSGNIQQVNVNFQCTDIKADSDGGADISLTHAVKFIIGSTSPSFPRSGNPGYISGKPILAGAANGTTNVLISSDPSTWLTLPGRGPSGYCGVREPVDFGRKVIQTCQINAKSFSTCAELGEAARKLAMGDPTLNRVGIFGNANPNTLGDWIPIFDVDLENSTTCSNIVVAVSVGVIYADVGSVTNPQHKILGVLRRFQTRSVELTSSTAPLRFRSSAAFYDVTQTAENVYNPAPVVTATLPEDFFYPLLRGGGASVTITSVGYVLHLVMLMLLLFLR